MKGTHLGEFEELIMLTAGVLYPEAYGVAIKKEIHQQVGRKVTLSAVHAALHRLEQKGFLESHFGEATKIRGGKRKKYFTLTRYGKKAIYECRQIRNQLWQSIPQSILQF